MIVRIWLLLLQMNFRPLLSKLSRIGRHHSQET
jgi:hypothetical protein